VSVQVRAGQRLKWRSKAWRRRTPEKPRISLADLQNDCLVHIFSFLGAGENIPPTTDEELSADFADEYLEQDRSVDFVDTRLTLQQAVALHKTMALISRRFHRLCLSHLPTILGHLDADLIINSWHRYTPWLTKNSLRLKSLRLRSDCFDDNVILLYILQRCDVSKLTTLSACFRLFGPHHDTNMWTMVDRAWHEKGVNSEESIINLVSYQAPATLDLKAAALGLPDLYEQRQVTTRRELHNAIVHHCPSVANLKLVHDLGDNSDPGVSSDALFRKKTIRELQLVLCIVVDGNLDFRASYDTGSVSEILRTLPNLKILKIGNGNRCNLHNMTFQLCSSSLQCINLLEAGKNNWMTRCVCPNLKRLQCLTSPYGNGVRARGDTPEIDLLAIRSNCVYIAGNARFDGTLDWGSRIVTFEGLNVPDSCLVSLVW